MSACVWKPVKSQSDEEVAVERLLATFAVRAIHRMLLHAYANANWPIEVETVGLRVNQAENMAAWLGGLSSLCDGSLLHDICTH